MAGIWDRPVGRGLGVCHDPDKWQAWIPGNPKDNELRVTDYPNSEYATVEVSVLGSWVPVMVSKALLCDLAWEILRKYERPHVQDDITKIQRKAGW